MKDYDTRTIERAINAIIEELNKLTEKQAEKQPVENKKQYGKHIH